MRKKRCCLLVAILVGTMLLSGCTGGSSGYSSSQSLSSFAQGSSDSYSTSGYDGVSMKSGGSVAKNSYDYTMDDVADADMPDVKEGRKLIYKGYVDLESTDFDASLQAIDHLVSSHGGYFETHDVSARDSYGMDLGTYRYADMCVRIPADVFDEVYDILTSDGIGMVVRMSKNADDVSENYLDIDTRLRVANNTVSDLEELLKQAHSVQDVLSVRNALDDANYQAESLQGQINFYDRQIAFSTINIDLTEVTALTMASRAASYRGKLVESFHVGFVNGTEFLGNLLLFIVGNWLIIIVIVLVIVLIAKASKKGHAKRKARREALRAEKQKEAEAKMEEIARLKRFLEDQDGDGDSEVSEKVEEKD